MRVRAIIRAKKPGHIRLLQLWHLALTLALALSLSLASASALALALLGARL